MRTLSLRFTTGLIAGATALALVAGPAWATAPTDGAGPTCHAAAAQKKLAGAAKTSFLKKCEQDAQTACDARAAEKKLAGAAKTSFTQKCLRDAVGQAPH
ncbi:hypothetical protein [Tepidimonas sp.]|uniref:hypothetical protein n=1 Tax=Tepidimonas sp. TaxID=2002775 RepID=UPI00391964D4